MTNIVFKIKKKIDATRGQFLKNSLLVFYVRLTVSILIVTHNFLFNDKFLAVFYTPHFCNFIYSNEGSSLCL